MAERIVKQVRPRSKVPSLPKEIREKRVAAYARVSTDFDEQMSSLAEEESRSISENVRWGQRKRFADGRYHMPYKQFLGYKKSANGEPELVEDEAKIIRIIYRLCLEGYTPSSIAKHLTESGVPTPSGKTVRKNTKARYFCRRNTPWIFCRKR